MKIERYRPLVVYMLHFSKPVGRARHYVGSTFEHLLIRRLHAHAGGRGASLTRAAATAGARLTLVMVQPIFSRSDEYRIKRNGHFKDHCPLCNGAISEAQAQFPFCEPIASPAWQSLHWTPEIGCAVHPQCDGPPPMVVKGSALPPAAPGDNQPSAHPPAAANATAEEVLR